MRSPVRPSRHATLAPAISQPRFDEVNGEMLDNGMQQSAHGGTSKRQIAILVRLTAFAFAQSHLSNKNHARDRFFFLSVDSRTLLFLERYRV